MSICYLSLRFFLVGVESQEQLRTVVAAHAVTQQSAPAP